MTTTVAIPAGDMAPLEDDKTGKVTIAKLPSAWRPAVSFFARAKLGLLKTRGPLVTNLLYWISKGLTAEDGRKIFARLCDPEVCRNHNFENQLMADLAGLVADCFRRKRMAEESRRRRELASNPTNVRSFASEFSRVLPEMPKGYGGDN